MLVAEEIELLFSQQKTDQEHQMSLHCHKVADVKLLFKLINSALMFLHIFLAPEARVANTFYRAGRTFVQKHGFLGKKITGIVGEGFPK